MIDTQPDTSKYLPLKVKFGYAVGQLADSLAYNLFYIFFLFFLTDVAGIPSSIAGTIILIAVIWDAITDPIIGHISDNTHSRWGRRRPLMIVSIVPYTLLLLLLFTDFTTLSISQKAVYFTVIAILFWTAYKIYVIPYYALGAEITNNFDERTSLRVWASYALNIAVLITSTTTPILAKSLIELGISNSKSWMGTSLIFAILTLLSGFTCWYLTRSYDQPLAQIQTNTRSSQHPLTLMTGIIKNMTEINKISSVRYLGASVFFWSASCALSTGAVYYLLLNNLDYSEQTASVSLLIYSLLALAWLPVVNYTARKFDKRNVYYVSLLLSSIVITSFYFIGFSDMSILIIYFVFLQLGNSYFWTVYYSMMYDLSELDDFINGKRREGIITALMSFMQKLGSAIAVWFIGFYMEINGYMTSTDQNSITQPASALKAILELNTSIAGTLGIIAALFAIGYPLKRQYYQALLIALQAKKENRPYTTDGFDKLL